MRRVKQIVGLDIGSRNVRAVWMQLRGGVPQVLRAEQLGLPLDTADPQRLIRPWLDKLGLLNGFAAIAMPGGQVVFQPGRLSPEDPRTPAQAAAMEIATFNDMAGDLMTYAVTSHEWSPGTRAYLMAMARPAAIGRAIEAVAPLDLRPADLVPAPVAVYNALDGLAATHTAPILFLEIGHSQTELAIGTSRGLLFGRSISAGGRAFTEAVAASAGVPLTQAEVQKHREASLLPQAPFEAVLRPVAERWLSQVTSCLAVYRGVFAGEPFAPAQVVLSGGGAQLRGMAEFVRSRLNLPVVHAASLPGSARLPQAGVFAVAAGLAATALEAAPAHLSLLPAKLRDEIVFREKKPYWIAAAVLGALTLGVFTVGMVRSLNVDAERLKIEQGQLREREKIDKGIKDIQSRTAAMAQRARPLLDLLQAGPRMREVLSLVANAMGPEDWISMICEEASYRPIQAVMPRPAAAAPPARPGFFLPGLRGGLRPAAAPAAPAAVAASSVPAASRFDAFIVEGYTPDLSLKSVRQLILRLRASQGVGKVDLHSDDLVLAPTLPDELAGLEVDVPNMRRFVLRLEVEVPKP